MTASSVPEGPPRTSAFEDIIYWTSLLSPEEIGDVQKDPRVLFKSTLLVVCAEYYTLVKYATARLAQLEWEIENPNLLPYVGGLEITIKKLYSWRRRFPIYRLLVSEVLEKVINRDQFLPYSENHITDLRRDFEILLSDIENLQVRADRIMAVVTAVMSIEESKKANEQNRSLARLTWLAVTFIPLSFVSSLFSMNPELSSLVKSFWIFFAVAIPLTVTVLFVTKYSDEIAKGVEDSSGLFSRAKRSKLD